MTKFIDLAKWLEMLLMVYIFSFHDLVICFGIFLLKFPY